MYQTLKPFVTMLRKLSPATLALAVVAAGSGCIIVRDRDQRWDNDAYGYDDGYNYGDDYGYDTGYDDLDDPVVVDIDIGAVTGSVEPGVGAGVFVETDDAGQWRIFTACDTDVSGFECGYELFVQGEGVSVNATVDLENDDGIDEYEDGVDLYFTTSFDFDSVTLNARPGAPLTLTMYLDGSSQPDLVYWVGNGVQNQGAPTNPIIFSPSNVDDI